MAGQSRGFHHILMAPVAALVVLAFGLAALLGSVYGERATHYLVRQLVARSADALQSHLQRYLEKPHLVVGVNADAMRFGEIDPQGLFRQPEAWFLRQHQRFPEIDDVYFARADGAIVGIDRTDRQLVLKITTDFPRREFYALDVHGRRWGMLSSGDYDATRRDWYKAAVAADAPVWSTVYPLLNKPSLGITAARPAYDPQGRRVGVMGVNLTLESISEHLRAHPVAVRSISYIVDPQGLLLASSSAGTTLVDRSRQPPVRVAAGDSTDTLVAASHRALAQGAGGEALEMLHDEARWWVYVNRYTDPRGLDWRLVSVVDPVPFLQGVRQVAQLTLVLGALLLLALMLLVRRVTRRLAQPLVRLAEASGRIAEGQYGHTLPALHAGLEVDRLVAAFNHMSQQLHAAHQRLSGHAAELEAQVQQRTQALRQSNEALRQAQRQADEATQAKSRFLSSLSHEIRTPLGTIIGLTALMRDDPDGAQRDAHLAMVNEAGRHLLNLVNAQLDLAKIEAGHLAIAREPLDIAALVARVVGWMDEPARAKGLQLTYSLPGLPPRLLGDATRLRQALLNYLANAVNCTDHGGVHVDVQVQAARPDALLLRFEVQDSGPGIAPDRLRRLFTPFEQVDDGTVPARAGVGLGLAITRALAQAMGGDAGAESVTGQGSRFHFTAWLPLAGATSGPEAPAPAATPADGSEALASAVADTRAALGPQAAGMRVLVVDDDPVAQLVTGAVLGRVGLQVVAAGSGAEGLQRAADMLPALVLLDLQLPDLPGLEVARRMRLLGPMQGRPILAVSANAFEHDRRRSLEAGLDDHLAKPLEPMKLLAAVRRWLAPDTSLAPAEVMAAGLTAAGDRPAISRPSRRGTR